MANGIIEISTNGAEKLDFTVASNLVDAYIKSEVRASERDMLAEPYFSLCKEIGFDSFIQPGVVQMARYAHPAMNGGGKGYNGRREDFVNDPHNTFETYGNGVLVANWQNDFNEKASAFSWALGSYCDICANVEHGTYEELDWQIQFFKPIVIFFGAEVVTYMGAEKYREIASDWIAKVRADYPDITCVLIPGLIYRENPKSLELSRVVSEMDADGHNQYFQLLDRVEKEGLHFTSDMDLNAGVIDVLFSEILDKDLEACKKLFGEKKMYVGQWNIEDMRVQEGRLPKQYVNNTMLGMSSIGRMIEYCVKNQDYIKYLAWMSHANLIDNSDAVSNNYLALKTALKITHGKRKVTALTITGAEGVSGVSVRDIRHHYILLNNKSKNDYVIDEVLLDGWKVNIPITQSGYYSQSWGGRIDVMESEGSTIPVPKCSMQVADFDLS